MEHHDALLVELLGPERAAQTALFAYVDDVSIAAEECDIASCIACWRTALAQFGLVENTSKTSLWTASQAPPADPIAAACWHQADRHDGFPLLGSALQPGGDLCGHLDDGSDLAVPVGADAYMQDFLGARLRRAEELARTLAANPGLCETGLPSM